MAAHERMKTSTTRNINEMNRLTSVPDGRVHIPR
jgi:hypothetical protein